MSKTDYERIRDSVKKWPQWKKDLANEMIVSTHAKKI